jgi:lipopolysaccharide heptosyltransferase II
MTLLSSLKRILIIRTDRIGDVVLSTPVIQALRNRFPQAYIAFLTGPDTEPALKHNSKLDEIIVYDKLGAHRSWGNTLRFAGKLRKNKFDIAFILHSTNRVNWITALAGIRHRVGYDRRLGFLLTQRLKYTKGEGKKHEVDYNLDLLKAVGINEDFRKPSWTVLKTESKEINEFLEEERVGADDSIVVVHPGASTHTKRWSAQKFSELCKRLADDGKMRVVLVSGKGEAHITREVFEKGPSGMINWGGSLNLRQLAALLKRARLFIANDGGPVHISTAVGTPVVSIFGRRQPGLGPVRWAPVGPYDQVAHHDLGCEPCIPDPCPLNLECLEVLSVDDVWKAVCKAREEVRASVEEKTFV